MASDSKQLNFILVIMVVLAIGTAIYPIIFAFTPAVRGLFRTKPEALLESVWYIPLFMVHISFGAIAIVAGSTQFFKKLRLNYLIWHRNLGKLYVAAVLPSGLAGLIVGFYATGAWYSKAGFMSLAIGWLYTTSIAYTSVRRGEIQQHRIWMMRSYAFCFAFVTFRIYLGIFTAIGLSFNDFYSYLSFLCWVPNILFIEWRIRQLWSP